MRLTFEVLVRTTVGSGEWEVGGEVGSGEWVSGKTHQSHPVLNDVETPLFT